MDKQALIEIAQSFTVIDGIIILVLLVSALLAYFRGFVHEALSVAGWIGAILAVVYGFPYIRPHMREAISNEMVADIAGGTVLFVVALLVLSVFTYAVSRRIRESALGALDRALGFLFGLARGALLVCLVYIGFQWVMDPDEHPDWVTNARTMKLVRAGSDWLVALIPDDKVKAGKDAAGSAREKTIDLLETQRQMDEILIPQPKTEGAPPPEGYSPRDRQGLDQLHDRFR